MTICSSLDSLDPTFFLFTTDLDLARRAERADIDSLIVDWEQLGKSERQDGFDTEINTDTPEDVVRLHDAVDVPITVRINQLHDGTASEIDRALACGAQALMLPMARTPAEVDRFVRLVDRRAATLVQIETQSLAQRCEELKSLDWDFAHVGLNDLLITGDHDWLWQPLLDGTIEHICETLSDRRIGFGSATVLGGGAPIPFVNLMQEMVRLRCTVTILRRTFKKEIPDRDLPAELSAYRTHWTALQRRGNVAEAEDHQRLLNRLRECRADARAKSP